jgi:folate-binding protein YgfZ
VVFIAGPDYLFRTLATELSIHRPDPARAWTWAEFNGPDAADFLHRLTTVDIHKLEVETGSPGCFLNPQGRVRISFQLWRLSADSFAFEYEAGIGRHWERALRETIGQYTFGEKLTFVPRTDLACVWTFPDRSEKGSEDRLPPGRTEQIGSIRFCRQLNEAFGRIWITAWGIAADLDAWLTKRNSNTLTENALERSRIESLWPQPDREITVETQPLEAGMRHFVADRKGCYPGQEVIEKVISLGSPARRLVLLQLGLQLRSPAAVDTSLRIGEPPVEAGKITSTSLDSGPPLALALVRKTYAKEGLVLKFGNDGAATVLRIAPYR